jgi:hypothetical protein
LYPAWTNSIIIKAFGNATFCCNKSECPRLWQKESYRKPDAYSQKIMPNPEVKESNEKMKRYEKI